MDKRNASLKLALTCIDLHLRLARPSERYVGLNRASEGCVGLVGASEGYVVLFWTSFVHGLPAVHCRLTRMSVPN